MSDELCQLLFRIDEHLFGLSVTSIVRVMPAIAYRRLPEHRRELMGLINLQGEIIPLINPRSMLNLPLSPLKTEDRYLLISVEAEKIALWVNEIAGLQTFTGLDIICAENLHEPMPGVFGAVALETEMRWL